jgi:hypothetical protein
MEKRSFSLQRKWERIEMNDYGEKVSENLIQLKRRDENNMKKNTLISIIYTVTLFIGMIVSCICDFAISGTMTWSLITLSSIFITWIVFFPVILLGKKGILAAMITFSILIIPFIYILSILININKIFSIGAVMSLITLVFMWIVYFLYCRLKKRKLLATGIAFLFAAPFMLLINVTLSTMIREPVIDIWDIRSVFILLIIAVAFIIGDYAQKRGYAR